jgi:hypothetical protein
MSDLNNCSVRLEVFNPMSASCAVCVLVLMLAVSSVYGSEVAMYSHDIARKVFSTYTSTPIFLFTRKVCGAPFPWPRPMLARLTRALHAMLALDINGFLSFCATSLDPFCRPSASSSPRGYRYACASRHVDPRTRHSPPIPASLFISSLALLFYPLRS